MTQQGTIVHLSVLQWYCTCTFLYNLSKQSFKVICQSSLNPVCSFCVALLSRGSSLAAHQPAPLSLPHWWHRFSSLPGIDETLQYPSVKHTAPRFLPLFLLLALPCFFYNFSQSLYSWQSSCVSRDANCPFRLFFFLLLIAIWFVCLVQCLWMWSSRPFDWVSLPETVLEMLPVVLCSRFSRLVQNLIG